VRLSDHNTRAPETARTLSHQYRITAFFLRVVLVALVPAMIASLALVSTANAAPRASHPAAALTTAANSPNCRIESSAYTREVATLDAMVDHQVLPAATRKWWLYVTYQAAPCDPNSYWYYDASAQLNQEMVKVAGARILKISSFLAALYNVLRPIIGNSKAAIIVGVLTGALTIAGLTAAKLYSILRRWWVGKGRHTGIYIEDHSVSPFGSNFVGSNARSCVNGWWELKCGSPGRLDSSDQE
jgi:hypothetical protein